MSTVHNETGNIYSHLIPGIIFTCLSMWEWLQYIINNYKPCNLVKSIAVTTMTSIFICSTIYHIGRCTSPFKSAWFVLIDVFGIYIGIIGIYIAEIYLGFLCDEHHQRLYLLAGCILFTIVIPILFCGVNIRYMLFCR